MDRPCWADAAFDAYDRQQARDEAAALAAEEAIERRVADLMDEIACSDLDATVTNAISGSVTRDGQPVDAIGEWLCGVDDGDESPERYFRMALASAAAAFSAKCRHGESAGAEISSRAGGYLWKALELACYRKAEHEAAQRAAR